MWRMYYTVYLPQSVLLSHTHGHAVSQSTNHRVIPPLPKYLEYPRKPLGHPGGVEAIPQVCPDVRIFVCVVSNKPHIVLQDEEYEAEETQQSSSGSMAASKQLRTEDFVIKYIEDDEE